jgi:hypothetical protein
MNGNNRFDDIARIVASPLPRWRALELVGGILGVGVVNALWPARARAWVCPDGEDLEKLGFSLHLSVAFAARRKLFVHAGVVGWRGKAIVIPGRSMTGKSEMVAALVRAGASYFSDEYAVLDRRGYVYPYAKPLTVRRGDGEGQRQIPVEVPRDLLGSKPLPVGLIVVGPYHAGAQWHPRSLTPGEAVLEMLDNTVLARYKPGLALVTLQRVASGASAFKGRRGNAEDIVLQIMRLLDDPSP